MILPIKYIAIRCSLQGIALTKLKGNSSQNKSKVHMKDRADFGLFAKFRGPNQFS